MEPSFTICLRSFFQQGFDSLKLPKVSTHESYLMTLASFWLEVAATLSWPASRIFASLSGEFQRVVSSWFRVGGGR